jgi:CubicO group peptidase (beta-lactamase class C family)
MPKTTRRALSGGLAAFLAMPGLARARTGWATVADRARALDQCHAVMVAIDGETVLAERLRGPEIGRTVPVKSVSKSVVAALLGAAIDRGEVPSVAARLGDLAPGLVPPDGDPRVADLTMAQLVTMTAGLERTSGANYGSWISSRDWVGDALSRPFVAEPGTRMLYSTGSFHVLGAVLAEVSGQSLLTLARTRLGAPLDVTFPAWVRDPQGRYLGGNEMAMSLQDMVRFGEMYRLDGAGVLSRDWVRASWTPHTRSPFSGMDYGYGWFLGRLDGDRFALARGYGGQVICVVPRLDMTLALTSDPTRPARSAGYFGDIMALIEGTVLPAARSHRV